MKMKLVAIATLLAMCASFTNGFAADKKDIGLQLYSLRAMMKKDAPAVIKQVGDMGYTAVETAGYGNGKFYGMPPADFKAKCEAAGLKVLSSHCRKGLDKDELEKKDFSKSLKWWDEAIAAHKAAGMKYIVDPYLGVPKTLEELQTICEYYNAIGKKCQENGLSFGYHNHAHEFKKVQDKVMFDYMIENTDPKLVFFEMDVYWVTKGGADPVAYFNKYPKRFRLLHIKDEDELGRSGMVNFKKIFENCKNSGVENIIVEVERYSKGKEPIQSVKESLDYLTNAPFVKDSYSK